MNRLHFMVRLLSAIAAVLIFAGPAFASATAGMIRGTVLDESDIEIPGALVTLTSPQMIGGAQQRTTDGSGRFTFVELPPGVYDLTVQKQGMSTNRRTGIPIEIGRTQEITITLEVGAAEITVVAERPVVDTENTSKVQTFNQEFLSRIPSGRTYQNVVEMTAGMVGSENSQGSNDDENTYTLDGVAITDPVTGTFSMNFNFDALQEIQVATVDFDPEYGTGLGARVSLVTKSGGNTLDAIASARYMNGNWAVKQDDRYAADGTQIAFGTFDTNYQDMSAAMTVSGPLIKDEAWFIASYEYNRSRVSGLGVSIPLDFDSHYFFTKLTFQPASKHRFAVSFNTDPTTVDNIEQNPYNTPDAEARQIQGNYATSVKWNWFVSPNANVETTVYYQRQFIEVTGVSCTHDYSLGYNPCDPDQPEGFIDFTTPAREGVGVALSLDNETQFYFDDRTQAHFYTKGQLLNVKALGTHDLKLGVGGKYIGFDQIIGWTGNTQYVDLYENSFDPDTRQGYYWIEYSAPYNYSASGAHGYAHLSDTYKPVKNLTVLAGVRYDYSQIYNDVGDAIISLGVAGPRISASWDPFGTEKTQVVVGYGRFNDLGTLGGASYLGQAGYGYKLILGEYFDNSVGNSSATYYDVGIENPTTVAPNLTAPHSDIFRAGAQREVIPDVAAGLDFTAKFTRNLYDFDETNIIFDEDGYSYIGRSDGDLIKDYRLRTPDIARRDYYDVNLYLNRYFVRRWLAQASYTYAVSKGSSQGTFSTHLSNPSQVDLWYGNLGTDVRHQVKAAAAWDLPDDPWTTQLGTQVVYYSAGPYSRYYYSPAGLETQEDGYQLLKQQRGTYARYGEYILVDVLITQAIPVKKGKLEVIGTVSNLFNAQSPLAASDYYISAENRYVVASRLRPLQLELGVGYDF